MDIHNPNWVTTVAFASDASGSRGCSAVWQQAWLQHSWDEEWKPQNIAAKELVPIAVACAVWGRDWCHQQVLVQCDNMSVVQVITAQSSKDRTLMHLLRCIQFFCAVGILSSGLCTSQGTPTRQRMLSLVTTCKSSSRWPPGAQTPHANSRPTVELPVKSAAGVEVARLEGVPEDLIPDSLVPSSCRAYQVGQSEFVQFCH